VLPNMILFNALEECLQATQDLVTRLIKENGGGHVLHFNSSYLFHDRRLVKVILLVSKV
jgi:hypothetical protein